MFTWFFVLKTIVDHKSRFFFNIYRKNRVILLINQLRLRKA